MTQPGAPRFTITPIAGLRPDEYCQAAAINNLGQVVGSITLDPASGETSLFVWQAGVMTLLNAPPNHVWHQATAINNNGLIIGCSLASGMPGGFIPYDLTKPFTLDNSWLEYIPRPELCTFQAVAVNDDADLLVNVQFVNDRKRWFRDEQDSSFLISGANGSWRELLLLPAYGRLAKGSLKSAAFSTSGFIVGEATVPRHQCRAFRWRSGAAVLLDSPGGSAALDVNDAGLTVGRYNTDAADQGYMRPICWPHAATHLLDVLPPFSEAEPVAVNNRGEIVGTAYDRVQRPYPQRSSECPVLWIGDALYDLNTRVINRLGWTLTSATGINDAGQILCTAVSSRFPYGTSILLQPVVSASHHAPT